MKHVDERVAELEEELRQLRGELRECEADCARLEDRYEEAADRYDDLHTDYLEALQFIEYVEEAFPEARVAYAVARRVSE